MPNKLQNDEACIAAWRGFISRFNTLVADAPTIEKVKKDLLKLKEEVLIKSALNYRQTQALTARIDNYLAGNYGNTKRPEHFNQGKVSTAK